MDTKHFLARLARICLTVFVILLSNLGCGDSTFVYQVSITEAGTSHPIENVLVRLEVATMSPLTGKSDSFGNARITIPSNYINRQGRLVIEMPGYKSFTQNLTLLANQLPTDVPLTRQGNIGNQSTPQATPTATVVPTTTSTEIAVAPHCRTSHRNTHGPSNNLSRGRLAIHRPAVGAPAGGAFRTTGSIGRTSGTGGASW